MGFREGIVSFITGKKQPKPHHPPLPVSLPVGAEFRIDNYESGFYLFDPENGWLKVENGELKFIRQTKPAWALAGYGISVDEETFRRAYEQWRHTWDWKVEGVPYPGGNAFAIPQPFPEGTEFWRHQHTADLYIPEEGWFSEATRLLHFTGVTQPTNVEMPVSEEEWWTIVRHGTDRDREFWILEDQLFTCVQDFWASINCGGACLPKYLEAEVRSRGQKITEEEWVELVSRHLPVKLPTGSK